MIWSFEVVFYPGSPLDHVPDHWTWELYDEDRTVILDGTAIDDPSEILTEIVNAHLDRLFG